MTICILGRQPELGLAELESLYGSEKVRPAGDQCALVDASVDFARLGGSVKAGELLKTLNDTSRKSVFKAVAKLLPELVNTLPGEGKVKLGLSVYGFDISPYELGGEALRLKKSIKSLGRSVRVVPNETPALSSAQTYHNRLADELGIEIIIVHDKDQTLIGRVTGVQNIDSYRIRDRERPKRDAFVGMLPPKLAQIIVNLATGDTATPPTVLDPFCGTGVVLQEALLMGFDAYGTDLSGKMIEYSTVNLHWLKEKTPGLRDAKLEVADATKANWNFSSPTVIACETYLGQPIGGQQPSNEKFAEIVHDANAIVRGFFANVTPQLPVNSRLCVAVPVWFYNGSTTHLPVIDELASMGLASQAYSHAAAPLMYHREDQVTGRELLVLRKIT